MALQNYTVAVGNLIDDGAGRNYAVDEPVYIKTTGGALAPIFRDEAGTSPIIQDGIANLTNQFGEFTFYVESGEYIIESAGSERSATIAGSDYFNNQIEIAVNQIIEDTADSRGFRVVGTFADGFDYELPNDVGINTDGTAWIYVGSDQLPVTVPPGTDPTASSDYLQVTFNDVNALVGVNQPNQFDEFYNRLTTVSEIESGVFVDAGTELIVKDRAGAKFIIESGGTPDGFGVLDAGSGNTAVLSSRPVHLEYLGVSESSTSSDNGAVFINSCQNYGRATLLSDKAVNFDFSASKTSIDLDSLIIDLKESEKSFTNFAGFTSTTVKHLSINANLDCSGTKFVNFMESSALEVIDSDFLCVKNVYQTSSDEQHFMFRYEHESDIPMQGNFKSVRLENFKNESPTLPMTFIGNFQVVGGYNDQKHQIDIENMSVSEWYSVDSDGITIIDGESDVFRIFNNPTSVNIGNLETKNVAKRVVKTQIGCEFSIANHSELLDSRFTQSSNHIACLEAQDSNNGVGTVFNVGIARVDYSSASGTPIYFNGSTDDHSISIDKLEDYSNISFFSSNANVSVDIASARGQGLLVNATSSDRVNIKKIQDSALKQVNCIKCFISNFDITFDHTSSQSSYRILGANLNDGNFNGLELGRRYATINKADRVTATFDSGAPSGNRPFAPNADGAFMPVWSDFQIENNTGETGAIWIHRTSFSGRITLNHFYANNGQLGFISSGTFDVILNDCYATFFDGAASTSVATYS